MHLYSHGKGNEIPAIRGTVWAAYNGVTLAEMAAHDAKIEALDVEGVLGFAEYLVANAGRLWVEASLQHRQMLQRAIFPEGLTFDGKGFGTAVACLAFMQLPESERPGNGVASLTFASWNQVGGWLRQIDGLRQAA